MLASPCGSGACGPRRLARALALGSALMALGAGLAGAEAPLSAIDWLSQSLAQPPAGALPQPPAGVTGQDVATPDVTVQPLAARIPDATGILSPKQTGLPQALWGGTPLAEIEAAINATDPTALPALQAMFNTLMLAEADPPIDSGPLPELLLTRVDRLLSLGALDQARALIEAAGPASSAELFRRSFDTSLLVGEENRACAILAAAPGLAPAMPTRVFCLARQGDWQAAALSLDMARALGQLSPDEAELLARFLDPDLAEAGPAPAPPVPVTPLDMKIFESFGEPLPTASLPLAFSHADLAPTQGWKARLEAAERLVRGGAIAPNLLLGLYTEQRPPASGGVWDRALAFQRLDSAVQAGDAPGAAAALPPAWAAMQGARLEVPFAELFGEKLMRLPLTGAARELAETLALLGPDYEGLTADVTARDARQAFLLGLARGHLPGTAPADPRAQALAAAFGTPPLPQDIAALLAEDRVGMAILAAIDKIAAGAAGDWPKLTEGLASLRHLGLEDVARRSALQLMILDRPR